MEEDGRALRSPRLVVPGDTGDTRQAARVDRLVIAVANPAPTTPPAPGAVTLHRGRHVHPLGAALVAAGDVKGGRYVSDVVDLVVGD